MLIVRCKEEMLYFGLYGLASKTEKTGIIYPDCSIFGHSNNCEDCKPSKVYGNCLPEILNVSVNRLKEI